MLVFIGWVISYANEWEDYSNYFGEGVEISRILVTTHSLVMAPLGVSFHLLIEDQGQQLYSKKCISDLAWRVRSRGGGSGIS